MRLNSISAASHLSFSHMPANPTAAHILLLTKTSITNRFGQAISTAQNVEDSANDHVRDEET
jgi:chorismate-pyruvate lyase